MQKFENMDVIAALEAIMHQNTAYYQSDFMRCKCEELDEETNVSSGEL